MYCHVAVLAEVKLQGTQPQYHYLVYDIARYTGILLYNYIFFSILFVTDSNKSFWEAFDRFQLLEGRKAGFTFR